MLTAFITLSTLFAIAMIVAGFLCQYKNNTPIKESTYECGLRPFSDAKLKFDIRYFNYAIIFLVFDIETIFLYPFAVNVNKLGIFAIVEAFLFITILLLGLWFVLKKKFLRWI